MVMWHVDCSASTTVVGSVVVAHSPQSAITCDSSSKGTWVRVSHGYWMRAQEGLLTRHPPDSIEAGVELEDGAVAIDAGDDGGGDVRIREQRGCNAEGMGKMETRWHQADIMIENKRAGGGLMVNSRSRLNRLNVLAVKPENNEEE